MDAVTAHASPLRERLRRDPRASGYEHLVNEDWLPVPFFGDLFAAQAAAIGLNPSASEYVTGYLQTLPDFDVTTRASLTDVQCDLALLKMRDYFLLREGVHPYFPRFVTLAQAMGLSYAVGEVVHLDLVQEAMPRKWDELKGWSSFERLRSEDKEFLRWQLEMFPLRAVICDGTTVSETVRGLVDGCRSRVIDDGAFGRRKWTIEVASIRGRKVGLLTWNFPLHQVGMKNADLQALGRWFRSRLAERGIL